MKSDPKKQYSNIKTISGFPAGEAGYDLGVSACYGGFIGDYMVVAVGVISLSLERRSIIRAFMLRRWGAIQTKPRIGN